MPFDNQNITIIIVAVPTIILFVWIILLQISLSKVKKNQKAFFEGKDAKNLEQVLLDSKNKITAIEGDVKDLYEITGKINGLASRGLHKTGMVRFNPFRDIGGDQSFSVALLDGEDNGVVISSLYSRDGVRVYAKSLLKGQSHKYPLTEEEKHAIGIATAEKDNAGAKKKV